MSVSIWYQAVLLGTWFGLLHAFDADHLATIGGLAARDRALPAAANALRWALGHAVAIGLVATAVLGLDLAGIIDWTSYAELLVCLALLAIGAQALRAAWRSARPQSVDTTAAPAALGRHVHTAARPHLHFLAPWHAHTRRGGHTSVAMGLIHGGAGSAAVLALLPLAHFQSRLASAVYLLCFSAGVAVGALAFAKIFALVARRSTVGGERLAPAFQAAVGAFAIGSGSLLLIEVVYGGG